MRNLALAFLFCLLSSVANAQGFYQLEKPVTCSTLKNIVETLSGNYGEVPHWNGIGTHSKYIMFVNPTNYTWTLVEYTDEIACVIGVGQKSTLLRFGTNT